MHNFDNFQKTSNEINLMSNEFQNHATVYKIFLYFWTILEIINIYDFFTSKYYKYSRNISINIIFLTFLSLFILSYLSWLLRHFQLFFIFLTLFDFMPLFKLRSFYRFLHFSLISFDFLVIFWFFSFNFRQFLIFYEFLNILSALLLSIFFLIYSRIIKFSTHFDFFKKFATLFHTFKV